MSRPFPKPQDRVRDGQSQADRAPRALDPNYVQVDERSPQDLLRFVRRLCRELRFVDPEQPLADLDWSGLIGDDVDLDRAIAYTDNPEAATATERERFSRPHFALLLAFIRLFGIAQEHLSALTGRHLDFFFAEVLRMQRRPPSPDTVNLVMKPARGVDAVLIAAGTEFLAGKDSTGVDRIYSSDRDLIVNQVQVAATRSLYVDQRTTGIREARERRDPGTNEDDRFVRMFAYALGEPGPGDPLPLYDNKVVDLALLVGLGELVRFSSASLFLELYELRALVQLKSRRDGANADWSTINTILQDAGRRRLENPQWTAGFTDPRDFSSNINSVIGEELKPSFFAGLPEVSTIDDLYTQRMLESAGWMSNAETSDVAVFIRERLFFPEIRDFETMMALKRRSDADWAEILRILERAGKRRRGDTSFSLQVQDPTDFAANFAATIGGDDFAWPAEIASVEDYDGAIKRLEAYMHMSAEAFAYVMEAAPGADSEPSEGQWQRLYGMLTAAFRAKIVSVGRATIATIREQKGWHHALYYALSEDPSGSGESPLAQLRSDIPRVADYNYLQTIDQDLATAEGDESSISAERWQRAIQIVELAKRVREQLPEPEPRRIEWRNLYAFADSTKVGATTGLASDRQTPRWHTFGAKPTDPVMAQSRAASFGFAVASPMLALSEGTRTVVLTLGFDSAAFDNAAISDAITRDALLVEISGEKSWLQPTSIEYTTGDYAALSHVDRDLQAPLAAIRLTLTFAVEVEALAPLPFKDSGVASLQPVLRVMMRPIWDEAAGEHITLYEPFRDLELTALHLQTSVQGLASLVVGNDRGGINSRRPFEPFGVAPASGSRLFIGHPELARNRLDSLSLRIQWMGAPALLGEHYANYGLSSPSNSSFKVKISAVDHRRSFLLADSAALFDDEDATYVHTIDLPAVPEGLGRIADFAAASELLSWDRYLEIELGELDFQHSSYGAIAIQKGVEFSAAIASGAAVEAANFTVKPPYTPKIKSLTVDYNSSVELVLDDPSFDADGGIETLFHVRAFGAHRIERQENASAYRLFPAHENAGELYIGLQNVQAPQQVTLLLQLAEGSADPDLPPAAIEWSYLSGDRWLSLHNGDLLSDSTRGLINTGIVALQLPSALPSTQMDPNLYWLRVSVARETESVCDVVEICTQAVQATLSDRGNASDHYEQPLPAGSITAPIRREARLAAVKQPYTSYGARAYERDENFHVRVSERLRHKQRALTTWDYERLILDRFPGLYKVKCMPAAVDNDADKLGTVTLLVIPDIRQQLPFDPFEPKLPADRIADIEAFIRPLTPPFARVAVKNPRYISVRVRFGVRFREGVDIGFYRKQLAEDLSRFLSPWAYAEGSDIVIGGRIYATSIIDFVDRREYVDHLATIKLFRSSDGRDYKLVAPAADGSGYYVSAEHQDEILVAARTHDIDVISDVHYDTELFSGINNMKVELDFVIG